MNGPLIPTPHERRSWHYPAPWAGVHWQPAPTPLRDLTVRAAEGLHLMAYVASWLAAGGTLLTSFAAAAVMIAGR